MEGRLGRLQLVESYDTGLGLEQRLLALELGTGGIEFRLRAFQLGLGDGVAVIEVHEGLQVKHRRVGAQLLMIFRLLQGDCAQPALLLGRRVERDDRLTPFEGNTLRSFNRTLALGLPR